MSKKKLLSLTAILVAFLSTSSVAQTKSPGIFAGQSEVGPVKLKGDVVYNAKTKTYIVSGSGADVFFTKDELHYVWKKVKGDFMLKANGAFIGSETHMYGKFGLMVRKSLDGNSAQVNAVVHGNKLSSLQWRKTAADSTYEQRTDVLTANVLQLQRKGNTYTVQLGHTGEPLAPAESIELDLGDEVYVGLFVCSHIPDKIKKVTFSNVSLRAIKPHR
jgi:TolB protein